MKDDDQLLAMRSQVCEFQKGKNDQALKSFDKEWNDQGREFTCIEAVFALIGFGGLVVGALAFVAGVLISLFNNRFSDLFLFSLKSFAGGALSIALCLSWAYRKHIFASLQHTYVLRGKWNAWKARIARTWLKDANMSLHSLGLAHAAKQIAAFEASMVGEKSKITQLLAKTDAGIAKGNELLAKLNLYCTEHAPSEVMTATITGVTQSLMELQQERERLEAMKAQLAVHVQQFRESHLGATKKLDELALVQEANEFGADCTAIREQVDSFLVTFFVDLQEDIDRLRLETQPLVEERAISVAAQLETGSPERDILMMGTIIKQAVTS